MPSYPITPTTNTPGGSLVYAPQNVPCQANGGGCQPENISTEMCFGSIAGQCINGIFLPNLVYLAKTSAAYVGNCPTPTITSIVPSTWLAGETYSNVALTGTNFTTQTDAATSGCTVTPVKITTPDGSVVTVANINVASETQITADITPAAGTTTEQATVTVGTAPNTATSATLATPPQILGNEILCDPSMNCTQEPISTTDDSQPPVQNVVVGQPMILNSLPLPNGITATKMTWTIGGTRIVNYQPTSSSASVTELKNADLKKANVTFYWVYTGDAIPVTYSYCANIPGVGNQCSEIAKASFNVTGPGDAQMAVDAYDHLNIDMIVDKQPCLPTSTDEDPYLEYGNVSGYEPPCPGDEIGNPQGMKFTPPTSSNGIYSFVQIVTGDKTTYSNGKSSASCVSPPGLDGGKYPYPIQPDYDYADDSPDAALGQIYKKVTRAFKATMYLLWTSSKTGAIPVPIGSQKWTITQGSTTNSGYPTKQSWTQPVWSAIGKDGDPVDYVQMAPSQPPYGYPTWSGQAIPVCASSAVNEEQQEEEQ